MEDCRTPGHLNVCWLIMIYTMALVWVDYRLLFPLFVHVMIWILMVIADWSRQKTSFILRFDVIIARIRRLLYFMIRFIFKVYFMPLIYIVAK